MPKKKRASREPLTRSTVKETDVTNPNYRTYKRGPAKKKRRKANPNRTIYD